MSSLLTLIVLGQVYFCGAVPIVLSSETNSTQVTSTVPSLIKFTLGSNLNARRPDYTYTEGAGAHKVFSHSTDWNTARRTCEEDGAHLVIINSVAEANAVVQLLESANLSISFVGVHDLYHEDEFVTIHGDPLVQTGYSVWRAGEPNNNSGGRPENCVTILTDAKFNDVRCDYRTTFVCESPYVQPHVLRYPL